MRVRIWIGIVLGGLALASQAASQSPTSPPVPASPPAGESAPLRLTLDEAKQRAVGNSKLLSLAAMNVEGKAFHTRATRADYFPQVIGSEIYFHFNDDLGTVLSTPGRKVTGPRGQPLANLPALAINVPILNQDSALTTLTAVQPLTALLKVRQGVKAARADEQIAQAQLDQGRRELVAGTEQLFWGLLAVQRIHAGAVEGVQAAEKLAKAPGAPVEVRLALAEARQGLGLVESQRADLHEQMCLLLELPLCTRFELVEPVMPAAPVTCSDEAVKLALASSPEVREAELTVEKAQAGVCVAKVDYLPNVVLMGGYGNQTGADYIQPNFGFVGVMGSYTFLDWGKRKNNVREAQTMLGLAQLKVRTTQDDVRQKALKAFRELGETREAVQAAEEMVKLRKEAEQKAATTTPMTDPAPLLEAVKKRGLAEVDLVKADMAYRVAHAKLASLLGQ
jgi:outer membrane protein TolC